MSSTTPAGWYPDPEREGATRWWDGAQWAPSQEPAASDDRFAPRDASTDAAATGADPSWSPEAQAGSGSAWDGAQDAGAQAEPSWSPTPASAPQPTGSTPAWQEQDTPSWQPQQSAPAWGQQGAAPSYGAPQGSDGSGAQQWNQYGAQPKKSRTGLIVGIAAGALVLVLLLVVGGGFLVTTLISNASQQVQTQGGGSGGGGTGGGTGGGGSDGGGTQGPGTFEVTVAADGQSVSQIEITTAGNYQIDVISTNSQDPRIELTGNGQSFSDDDGGDEPLASRLNEYLAAGTYTLMVEEYGGDPLVAQVTVAQR